MTEIDFYILTEESVAARDHFACRLAEKAVSMGRHVVIHVSNQDHAQSLSQYLWSFKPESFIPHSFTDTSLNTPATEPVVIDWLDSAQIYHDVLINLNNTVPKEFSRFQKLSEIVVQEPDLLSATRSHFQFYRERGYPLKSHNIS